MTRGHRATGRAISTRDVRRILKEVGQLAGIDASGHSVRVGMTQDLIATNADLPSIMQAGAWKSAAMPSRYGRKSQHSAGQLPSSITVELLKKWRKKTPAVPKKWNHGRSTQTLYDR